MINIFKISRFVFIFSILCIGLILYYVKNNDIKYGLEFSGGTEVVVGFNKEINIDNLRFKLESISGGTASVQVYDSKDYLIKFPVNEKRIEFNEDVKKYLDQVLYDDYKNDQPLIKQIDYIGPKVGQELVNNGLMALLYGSLAILIYVFFRFNFSFAISAIAALFHDFLIALFFIIFLDIEITLSTIAALLTVIGYSVNDTIVIFDRVRENMNLLLDDKVEKIINISIIQTLSRTILTVITVLIVLLPLYFFGGPVIEDFSIIMIIGVAVGTYSSIFFAPFLMYLISKWRTN